MYALSLLDIGFKFELHVYYKFDDLLMTAFELKKQCNIKC